MPKVVIYTRISLDRNGDSVSPSRQAALCRQMAEARGYEVGHVYEDRDASGWRREAKRPGFKAMEAALDAGEAEAVMAYSLSRFGRRATALLDFAERLKDRGIALLLYDQGVDTSTPAGQMFFTILAAFAEMESAQTSEKVKSHHRLAASQGKMHKGGVRSFGYGQTTGDKDADAKVRDHINLDEAEAVRTVTAMLLGHQSLGSCARWLNEQGITTTKGNVWNGQTLSQALRAPRIGGLRHHDGANLPGDWESVLDEETWTRLVAELDSRRNKGSGRSVQAHLLTGLAKCGRCGCSLKAASFRQANGKLFNRYQCLPREGLPNCGSLAASKATVDRLVVERFLEFMSSASLRPVDDRTADLQGEAEELEGKINKLTTDHYVHARLTDAAFMAAYDQLAAELSLVQQAQRAAA
ncbi:MAG: recombinase family protein, partial [Acidimicrobiales bacterium]